MNGRFASSLVFLGLLLQPRPPSMGRRCQCLATGAVSEGGQTATRNVSHGSTGRGANRAQGRCPHAAGHPSELRKAGQRRPRRSLPAWRPHPGNSRRHGLGGRDRAPSAGRRGLLPCGSVCRVDGARQPDPRGFAMASQRSPSLSGPTAGPQGLPCLLIRDWPTLRWRCFQDDLTRGPEHAARDARARA